MLLQKLGVFGSLDKRRGLAIAGACIHTFFDVYLKGASSDGVNRLPAQYPELKAGVAQAFAPSN